MYQCAEQKNAFDIRIIIPEILRDITSLYQFGELSENQRKTLSLECAKALQTKDVTTLQKELRFMSMGVSSKEKITNIMEKLAAIVVAEGEKNG